MEVLNGVVSNPITYIRTPSSAISSKTQKLGFPNVCFRGGNRISKVNNNSRVLVAEAGNSGFANNGHFEYYEEGKGIGKGMGMGMGKGKKGWNTVSAKKRIKLLKGLTKDLSTFSEMGFGLSFDSDKNFSISQAAEVLLAQLKQLRAEEEREKKKEKEEKMKCKKGDCESSSSESESSDSECDEVVDMKRLRGSTAVVQPVETKGINVGSEVPLLASSSSPVLEGSVNDLTSLNSDQTCCNMILETALNKDAGIAVLIPETSNLKQSNVGAKPEGKRIEVCMGGKCKKSGAPALIEEFQKAVGIEGAVVGCKCMGKCKSGPNVKLTNGGIDVNMVDDSLRTPTNPLYIGVGLEDVDLIVANCFGEELKGLGLSIAGVTS